MKMTVNQENAVAYRGNLLVSAAAGAGKTAVLTERICQIILDAGGAGVPLGDLLVMTFTRAAAAEMKSRIEKKLRKYAAGEELPEGVTLDSEKRSFLLKQVSNMGSAYITTFDAFCGRVLRRHGHLIGIPSGFRIIDEMEGMQRRDRVKDLLLTECGDKDESWRTLLVAFGDEDKAWECVELVCNTMESLPHPEKWLNDSVAAYSDVAITERALNVLVEESKEEIQQKRRALLQAQKEIDPIAEKAISVLAADLDFAESVLAFKDYNSYRQALEDYKPDRMSWKNVDADVKERVDKARTALKDCIKGQSVRFSHTAEEEAKHSLQAKPVAEALKDMVLRFREMFAEDKRKAGCLDYADMEQLSLKLFTEHEEVREEYREKFRYISVDEYQDTNGVQEELIGKIAREDNLFFVGDIKQSIYRFRHADPGLFLNKQHTYTGEADAPGKTILLQENFRSTGEVIGAVNELFSVIMTEETCGIDYKKEALKQGANEDTYGAAELAVIERKAADVAGGNITPSDYGNESENSEGAEENPGASVREELENISAAQEEARFIAGRIRRMMKDGEAFIAEKDGKKRRIKYSDIAILMRSRANAADYVATLAQEGIPCYAQTEGGYFETVEVRLALDLLRVIDNRRQDIPLLAVMRSDLGGFSVEDLVNIRLKDRKAGFFDALERTAAEADGVLPEDPESALTLRAKAFLEQLDQWRRLSQLVPLSQLISVLLTDSGFYAEMGALVDGKRRQANLDALIEAASRFEQSGSYGIASFLRYVEAGGKGKQSLSVAQQLEADVVRLMTVHSSKGLEFPVVFYADLGKKLNTEDLSRNVQIIAGKNGEEGICGIGLKIIGKTDGLRRETALWRALRLQAERESKAEEMRVLYVGMTRARQMLILSGSATGAQKLVDEAETKPDTYGVKKVKSALGWVLMGPRRTLGEARVYPKEAFLNAAEGKTYPDIPAPSEADLVAFSERMASVPVLCAEASVPLKVGVSTVLKRENAVDWPNEEEPKDPFRTPAFASEPKEQVPLTATERGTAVHTAAAYLSKDPKRYTHEEIHLFLDGLLAKGIISSRQREIIPADMLVRLSNTPLWQRLADSPRVEREIPFSLPVCAREVLPTESEKEVLLQGVIDCCFIEENEWVLLDYKTDRVRRGTEPKEVAMRHVRQMDYYQRALEKLTGKSVKARYIVLLDVGVAEQI